MNAVAQTFGPMFPLFLGATALYFLTALAPLTWPLWRAYRLQLPRRLLFCAVVASLVYGGPTFVFSVGLIPAGLFDVFLAPQLVEYGEGWAGDVASTTAPVVKYWWLGAPAVLLALTLWLTRWLGRRWPALCDVLATHHARAQRAG
jgi:hypothetical protein